MEKLFKIKFVIFLSILFLAFILSPSPVKKSQAQTPPSAGTVVDVVADGTYAYMASTEHGLVVADVTAPANPIAINSVSLEFSPTHLDKGGNLVVLIGGAAGLTVVDVTNPVVPVKRGSLSVPAYEVTVSAGYAYIADATPGTPGYLKVISLSDPNNPSLVANLALDRLPREIAIVGNLAYIATSNKICVVDVSVPASPFLVSSPPIGCALIIAKPGLAYIPGGGGPMPGVTVLDISDPLTITVLGQSQSLCYVNRLALQGNYVYLVGPSMYTSIPYLQIFDVTTPTAPVTTSYRSLPEGTAESVAVSGSYAYVAAGSSGLHIVDVSDPYNMVVVGTLNDSAPHLTKSVNPAGSVSSGATLTYTITYTNGNQNITNFKIEDPIPAGTSYVAGSASNGGQLVNSTLTWNLGDLSPGASGSVSFQVRIN